MVEPPLVAARSSTGGRAVVLQQGRQLEGKKEGATFGDFEKANVAISIMKLSRKGIQHVKNQKMQKGWMEFVGYSTAVALLVVLALGVCRNFLKQNKSYVAPQEQDDEHLPVLPVME